MKSEAPQRKLLAINFGGLGDEVLFLPTLQSIKSQHASWRITLLTEPRGSAIAQISDLIDDNLTFDIKKRPLQPADYLTLLNMVRSGGYEIVVSSGSSPQVSALLFLSGIPRRVGYGANQLARILLTDAVPLERDQHAARMYHDLVKGLGIDAPCQPPRVNVDQQARQRMLSMMEGATRGSAGQRVLIHPGTSKLAIEKGVIKTWPPAYWSQLIVRLLAVGTAQVVLAGGPDDAETVQQISQSLPAPVHGHQRFINAYGRTANIQDLVALIDVCDVVVCVDSAPMHLAVARNRPLVALFGPTDPNKLLWPDRKFIALRDPEVAKRWSGRDPFTQRRKHSPASPPQPEPGVQIPPDTVFQTVMDQLSSTSSQGSSRESLR